MKNDRITWQGAAKLSLLTAILLGGWMAVFSARAAEHIVEIRAFKFVPDSLTVQAGDKIIWINKDITPHTATAEDGSWDTKRLKKDEKMSVTVSDDMKLNYFCRFHPQMKATLVLRAD